MMHLELLIAMISNPASFEIIIESLENQKSQDDTDLYSLLFYHEILEILRCTQAE